MAKNLKALGLIVIGLLLSFRLTSTPPGLTVDEAAFGYNGVLLSKTLHDENGRFMPLFVSSIGGQDWRQPVTQYFIAGLFKILPPSTFVLRFSSVMVALLSVILLSKLASKLLSQKAVIFSVVLFIFTPIIFIQSHMALDNIMVVPFTILWLLGIYYFEVKNKLGFLFLAGVSLGISLYSYKAMRVIVPSFTVLSIVYFYYLSEWKIKKLINPVLAFLTGLIPFFTIMILLRNSYPGAIAGGFRPSFMAWDHFIYPIISTFDPSFLFIKGDLTIYHSTGIHGMLLLASLPFFLIGSYQAIKNGKFWVLVLSSFFAAPLLFGLVDSVYRASRLLAMVPPYVLISALGVDTPLKGNKIARLSLFALLFLMLINFSDFAYNYWYKYPKRYVSDFSSTKDADYKALSKYSKENALKPYIEEGVYKSDGEVGHFFEAAYFEESMNKWKEGGELDSDSVLLTYRDKVEKLKRVDLELPNYFLYVKE